ncbi:MAG: hypothetical protein AAF514_22820, partial [Verrucomicrobiota bacterium]
ICELMNVPSEGMTHRLGCLIPGLVGIFGPLLWAGDAKTYLAIPTSVIGGALLPIAYFTFLLLMNSKSYLGDARPRGLKRVIWNVLMGLATLVAGYASVVGFKDKKLSGFPIGWVFLVILGILLLLGLIGFFRSRNKAPGTS